MNGCGMSLLSAGYPATNQDAQVEMMTEVYVYLNHEHGVMNHEPWFSEGKKKNQGRDTNQAQEQGETQTD